MTQEIKLLNSRLAEALGHTHGQPRFQWRYSPEVFYYLRMPSAINFSRYCWADQIGKVWMLCQVAPLQWIDADGRVHPITREGWYQTFRGEFPYPDKGMYVAHTETALPPGVLPDAEETQVWIASLYAQIPKSEEQHAKESAARIQKARDDNEREFMEMADDSFPAFWKNGQGHEAGKRGAHVSFGGI